MGTGAWEAAAERSLQREARLGGTVGPGLRWNVLNYGRLVNNIRIQDAPPPTAGCLYQQTVLKANEEAENAIVGYLHFTDQIKILEQSVNAAREAERVAELKYRAGEIDFNRLFTVQQLLLSQQESLASLAETQLAAWSHFTGR